MRYSLKFIIIFIIFSFTVQANAENLFSVMEKDNSSNEVVAVHDFSISPELAKMGIKGWDVTSVFENYLRQKSDYSILTRAKLAKVIKEMNISTQNAFSNKKILGADFIITGDIFLKK